MGPAMPIDERSLLLAGLLIEAALHYWIHSLGTPSTGSTRRGSPPPPDPLIEATLYQIHASGPPYTTGSTPRGRPPPDRACTPPPARELAPLTPLSRPDLTGEGGRVLCCRLGRWWRGEPRAAIVVEVAARRAPSAHDCRQKSPHERPVCAPIHPPLVPPPPRSPHTKERSERESIQT